MKKQSSNNSLRIRKNIPAGGLRGISQSFVSVGIPTVLESSVREEYSYFKKQGKQNIFHTLTGEIKVKL